MPNPIFIMFIGGVIALIGGFIGYWGKLQYDLKQKKSSEIRDDKIETIKDKSIENIGLSKQIRTTTNSIDTITTKTNELSILTNLNIELIKAQNQKIQDYNLETDKNISIVKKINEQQAIKLHELTGGNGYLDIDLLRNGNDGIAYFISNLFSNPIYDMNIQITDYSKSKLRDKIAGKFIPGNIEYQFKLSSMNASTALIPMPPYQLESLQTEICLQIRINYRNGSSIEWLKILEVNTPNWIIAKEINFKNNYESEYKIMSSRIDTGFPTNTQGEVEWYK